MVFPTAIGPHRVWREGDVIGMQFVGPLTLAHVEVMRGLMLEIRGEHGRCYMLADAAGLAGISADARKALSDWARRDPEERISGVGVHGINFAMRALSMLTLAAINFMTRRPVTVHFAGDEAQARAWIAERRASDAGPGTPA
jgi:hypothetical protein